ncbi:MAG: Gfo/Idh/MocA family oxidoreductase, partial [Oscillospiraceae bacterium]|nr:Gfo/Idh/MocA family oxidoreductase [Oscillospiraceae bacterium]
MKIALVGASGYAAYYLSLYEEYINEKEHPICAVIDPFAARSEYADWIRARRIPVYETLDDFYRHDAAALVMIVSPIAFHREQAITAMEHASAVLCEKPLTATLEDAEAIRAVWHKTKVPFGVGFQWSFSKTMRALKGDIISGRLGKPLCLRTHTSWKRPDAYYDPDGWKGRLKDRAGRWVMDSIAMNATAHFLHNLFFIMGEEMDASMLPEWIEGSVYRARAIESYDTIFLRGSFKNGCRMAYTA